MAADEYSDPFRGPLLIVGADRSGTTLLRLLVNSLPEIQIPPESWFLIEVEGLAVPPGPIDAGDATMVVDTVVRHPRFADWSVTDAELRLEVSERSPHSDLGALVECIFRCEVGAVDVWGDKTPEYVFWLDPLRSLFPQARVVCCIRDPRDVAMSLLAWGWRGRSAWEVSGYLNRVWDAIDRVQGASSLHLVVRYEDLVLDPQRELARVCGLVGVEAPTSVPDLRRRSEADLPAWERDSVHVGIGRTPRAEDAERWAGLNRRRDRVKIAMVEARTRRVIAGAGYRSTLAGWQVAPMLLAALIDHGRVVTRPARIRTARRMRRARRRLVGGAAVAIRAAQRHAPPWSSRD